MSDSPQHDESPNPASGGAEPEVLTVDDLMGPEPTMPEVQTHTVDAARATTAKEAEAVVQNAASGTAVKGQTDDLGRPFDAALHEVGEDGKPRMNKAGYIAKRRGGASKVGAKPSASKVNTKAKDGKAAPVPPNLEPQIQATAQVSTVLFITCAQLVGGEDFRPVIDSKTGENEPQQLQDAFAGYFRAKGIIDIPPGVALAVGLGGYVLKRWNAEKFKARREKFTDKVKRWWADFRYRRQLAREKAATVDDGTAEPSSN